MRGFIHSISTQESPKQLQELVKLIHVYMLDLSMVLDNLPDIRKVCEHLPGWGVHLDLAELAPGDFHHERLQNLHEEFIKRLRNIYATMYYYAGRTNLWKLQLQDNAVHAEAVKLGIEYETSHTKGELPNFSVVPQLALLDEAIKAAGSQNHEHPIDTHEHARDEFINRIWEQLCTHALQNEAGTSTDLSTETTNEWKAYVSDIVVAISIIEGEKHEIGKIADELFAASAVGLKRAEWFTNLQASSANAAFPVGQDSRGWILDFSRNAHTRAYTAANKQFMAKPKSAMSLYTKLCEKIREAVGISSPGGVHIIDALTHALSSIPIPSNDVAVLKPVLNAAKDHVKNKTEIAKKEGSGGLRAVAFPPKSAGKVADTTKPGLPPQGLRNPLDNKGPGSGKPGEKSKVIAKGPGGKSST